MKKIFLTLGILLFPFTAFAGSQTYSTPGTHTFTVPNYTGTLTVEVWGGGQYPVAYAPFMGDTHGAAGGDSGFNVSVSSSCTGGRGWLVGESCVASLTGGVIATGGRMTPSDPVTPGMGSGGDINLRGNPPIQAEPGYVGIGGNAPHGGIGGFYPNPSSNPSGAGQQPGGGGGNIGCAKFICWDRGGASGGYSKKTYATGALPVGTAVTVVVGAGGNEEPSSKGDGMVKITWTDAAAAPVTSAAPVCGAVTDPTTKTTGTSGSHTFSSVGSHSFNVPQYNGTLTVEVWGGGQYPVAYAPFMGDTHGAAGTASSCNNTVVAGGGHMAPGDPVAGGIASGGDININGAPPIQA
ncbi:hypothetical protein HYT05_00745, partial [Candidatus Kaiserbacteria bacterium]|nr:hypothetical protein [Candidatus Kaiserbacteria bacterium]